MTQMISKSSNDQDFIFIINDKEYKCDVNAVNSSKVIRELREKDPNLYHYNYDFNDNNGDFEIVCRYFKTYNLGINTRNMRSLLQIAEDLQIENILDDIHHFIDKYEKMVEESEYISEIFYQLYHIKELTVLKVKDYILKSIWLKPYEKIQELAAFILQVVRTSYKLQPYIIDLLILLDQSPNENNDLKKLLPFIVDKILDSFYKTPFLCSFIFKLSKRGILTIDKIIKKICLLDPKFEKLERNYLNNIALWFFPELIEANEYTIKNLLNNIDIKQAKYICLYYPNKIDSYKKIRDTGEPDDELMVSVLNDDIEKFQSIISKMHFEINSKTIPLFLYENVEKSYINYAAENGSIKCFKYLLLNHALIDNLTLQCSIVGGNTEIIRIVDNSLTDQSFDSSPEISNSIMKAIEIHNNEIFDWLFENKINTEQSSNENILKYISTAVANGNIASYIKFLENINLYNICNCTFLNKQLTISSNLGFYQMIKFLLFPNQDLVCNQKVFYSSVKFGNLSIFKNIAKRINSDCINKEKLLLKAIQKNNLYIVKYIFDEEYMHFNRNSFINIYSNSLKLENPEIFNYLQSKFSYQYLKEYFSYDSKHFFSILYEGCPFGNMESVQKTTDFIIINYPNTDFTDLLIRICKSCLEDECLYFLGKKVQFNFLAILQNYNVFLFKNGKIALKLIELASPMIKFALSQYFLNQSIQIKNYKIAKLLINQKCFNDQILFAAVQSHDVEFVDKILQINKCPSFVNQVSTNGTALYIAVKNNDVQIVKRLLDVPGIDTNLSNFGDSDTPLILSIKNKNIEIAQHLLKNPNTNINIRNMKQETALTIAVENELQDIISLLINHSQFIADKSNIDYAFYISTDSISKLLYQTNKINVNFLIFQNSSELNVLETSLMHAVYCFQIEKIDLIINDDHFDPIISQINEAIAISLLINKMCIFKKLYNFLKNSNGNLLLSVNEFIFDLIIMGEESEYIEQILICEEIEIDEKYIYKMFLNSPLKTMEKILQYDEMHHHYIDFDQLLPNGKSFFTQISDQYNEISNITQFFLDKNVDPNRADKYNIYPLEHAINENSIGMVKTLINSGKIDFTMKKKDTEETYLHLAVHCSNNEIVSEILKQKTKITDSISKYDETPILKAINISNLDNAMILNREDGDDTCTIKIYNKEICLNFKEIMYYMKKETEKGDPSCTVTYGKMHEAGSLVDVDKKEACKYYKIAANKNYFLGIHYYGYALAHGIGINVDYKEACKYFKKGIKKDYIYSMIHYGYMLDNGYGVSINHDEANFYYDLIAQNESLDLINRFAELFETGIYFPVNLKEAYRYYKISADRGNTNAMKKIANMLENGIGTEKDVEKAKMYYQMAEEKKGEVKSTLLF